MSDDERTDGQLLAAAARGDDRAFHVLVRRYIRPATLLATQLLGDRDAAEDIVQDAFVVVHKQALKFDPDRPFAPWCLAIIRRLAANRRARELRRARLMSFWRWSMSNDSAYSRSETILVERLDADFARRILEGLPQMQRQCFELVAVCGFSNEEVAAMHGISESTVRQHVFRARAALRSILEGTRKGDL